MQVYFDNSSVQGIYGNRVWVKDISPMWSDLPKLLNIVSMWQGPDKIDDSTGAKSWEVSSEIYDYVVEIIKFRFSMSIEVENDPTLFFERN